ncbi:MAG: hypothetical protein FWG98_11580 [Candidatus Cloacimonetes bacterium]|nr:hypothetical protein [Candidatus Cloacimonadota bacterium]
MRRLLLLILTLILFVCSLNALITPRHEWYLNVNFNIPEVSYIQINGTSLNFDVRFRGFTHNNMWQVNNIPMTYMISVNGSPKRLIAQLSEEMPSGIELSMRITAPDGAYASPGFMEITSTPRDVLNYLQNIHNQHRTMEFQLTANNDAPVTTVHRTITFTLMDE